MAGFIPDGFTMSGHIKPEPGVHEGCDFEFRPGLPVENARIVDEKVDDDILEKRTHEYLIAHLVSWNLKNPRTGQVVERTEANMGRVNPLLRTAMTRVIMGVRASDPKQDQPSPQKTPDTAAQAGNS